ncbi:MAG: hypothetical protein KDK51_03440 [Deltaproteobacteria bacterium]|nr:hypothetical protein [Deltaproteobacteria bacterium]
MVIATYYGVAFAMLGKNNITALIMDITCDKPVYAFPVPTMTYLKRVKNLQGIPTSDDTQTLLQFILAGYGDRSCNREKIEEVVEIFLHAGFDINEIAPNGLTVLHDAVIWADKNLVEYLLNHGADPEVMAKEPSEHEFLSSYDLNKILLQEDAKYNDRLNIQMIISKHIL